MTGGESCALISTILGTELSVSATGGRLYTVTHTHNRWVAAKDKGEKEKDSSHFSEKVHSLTELASDLKLILKSNNS